MSGEIGTLILVLALLLWVQRAHRARRWGARLVSAAQGATRLPSLTMIRPLKGIDSELPQNLKTALNPDYPGDVETLFVVDDEREPALPFIRAALDEFRRDHGWVGARVIFSGEPPLGRTGKLNAMIAGLREARGEIIAFADSDTRPGPGALPTLVETLLSRPDAAASFAPVVATSRLETAGDAGYALLLNGLYGPMAGRAARRNDGTLPFIMGQFMAWRREALDRIGGLESAEGQLVDDMYLGLIANARGYANVVSPQAVPIIQSGLTFRDFLGVYVRWITFSRSGLPAAGFKSEGWLTGMAFWVGLLLVLVALWSGALLLAVAAGTLALAVVGSMEQLHVEQGGAPIPFRLSWMSLGVMLLAPWIMLRTIGQREVEWRGRRYRLDAGARLALDDEPPSVRRQELTAHW